MSREMRMPDLSTTGSTVRVVRWLVLVGEAVRRGQPLLEVETDKAIMEVESAVTGRVKSLAAAPQEEVAVGQVIAVFEKVGDATPS